MVQISQRLFAVMEAVGKGFHLLVPNEIPLLGVLQDLLE